MELKPFYRTKTYVLFNGESRETLSKLPARSIQMAVTSPPYFGLRDYGIDNQIGLEDTPVEYVDKLVVLFEELRRVLKDDGTFWLNIGDTYSGGGRTTTTIQNVRAAGKTDEQLEKLEGTAIRAGKIDGIKPKDLVGIPWMLAFALRDAGWYLRSDIIWHKLNGMPESVKDRPTSAHEHMFLLAKSADYYYDWEAIAEPSQVSSRKRGQRAYTPTGDRGWPSGTQNHLVDFMTSGAASVREKSNKRNVWSISSSGFKEAHFATFPPDLIIPCILAGSRKGDIVLDPFMGSGTTAAVAQGLSRRAIGIELNPEYCDMSKRRDESRPVLD